MIKESVVYLTVTRNVKCMRMYFCLKLHVINELLHIRNQRHVKYIRSSISMIRNM